MTATERYQWLLARKSSIGSSDAPNLCGVGFRSAAEVYREKTSPVTEADVMGSGILKRGTMLEPLVAQEFSEVMGIPLERAAWMRSPERPWQTASPDFQVVGDPKRKVETKTVGGFNFDWGMSGTDDFPENYRIQCQHQMGVCGLDRMHLAALDIITWELRVFILDFNPYFFEWLTDIEEQAWRMIESQTPIGPEWEQQWSAEARDLIDNELRFELPADTLPILQRRQRLKEIETEAKAAYDSLSAEIYRRMGDYMKCECQGWKVSQWFVKPHIVPESERAGHRSMKVTPPKLNDDGTPKLSAPRSKKVKVFK